MTWKATITIWLVSASVSLSADLTHGPIVGHTTDHSARIWIRSDRSCALRVRLLSSAGAEFLSTTTRLKEEDNFCGTVDVEGLAPRTRYRYQVLLDGVQSAARFEQSVMTYVRPEQPSRLRIGFGHSLRGPGAQTTWQAIAAKQPDLFILMGDNIYSNTTNRDRQRSMYLEWRSDPHFLAFAASTPIYAVWDDHDYGANNSDRTQPGKERSLKTFNEIWPNPASQADSALGISTRFTIGQAEFFLLDVRYHRAPDDDRDGPTKTMLGSQQREWLKKSLAASKAIFKFPVSGSSWNCGGVEAWNHAYTHAYDALLESMRKTRTRGVILLGGDQHNCKIAVRPRESWGGYDLHEWMAGQLWNQEGKQDQRGFGIITVDTTVTPATAKLEFFDQHGKPRLGTRIPYTTPGALRTLWDSPPGSVADRQRAADGEIRRTTPLLWDALPAVTGETLTSDDLRFP